MVEQRKNNWLAIMGVILIIVSAISIIWFFLRGETTIVGQNGGIINRESFNCEAENAQYQFLGYDNATRKNAKVTAVFDDGKFSSISLLYTLYYNDKSRIENSKTVNSAELNVFYGKDGLPANSFSKSLYADDEKVTISLYANKNNFNSKTSKYFMADNLNEGSDYQSFIDVYVKGGFYCIKINDDKEANEK